MTREELNFMNSILNNDGQLDPHKPLSLDQTSWLNKYADQGFWGYGLNIAGGWLTVTGRDYFIEMLWDDELPRGATSLRVEVDIGIEDVDQFAKGLCEEKKS